MSVSPARGLSGGKGPPFVVRAMMLKLLKLKANELIKSGATATSRSGNTTARNAWYRRGPSAAAGPGRGCGGGWGAPRQTREKDGEARQNREERRGGPGGPGRA